MEDHQLNWEEACEFAEYLMLNPSTDEFLVDVVHFLFTKQVDLVRSTARIIDGLLPIRRSIRKATTVRCRTYVSS